MPGQPDRERAGERNQLGCGDTPQGHMAKDCIDLEERTEPGQGLEMRCCDRAEEAHFSRSFTRWCLGGLEDVLWCLPCD